MLLTQTKHVVLILFGILILLWLDPALANKFETIGGGVSGSNQQKIDFLKIIAYVAGVIFILAAGLSYYTRNQNAQSVNYTMWKASMFIFALLGILFVSAGVLI